MDQCLHITADLPIGQSNPDDVRYRYPTFTAGFYSRPLHFGKVTPGLGLAFLTRVGRFDRDMGIQGSDEMETDLAVRATAEVAWEILHHTDLMAEGGADCLLDRWLVSGGGAAVSRGDRLSPWLEASIRYRAY
jgi:hypothetical protein